MIMTSIRTNVLFLDRPRESSRGLLWATRYRADRFGNQPCIAPIQAKRRGQLWNCGHRRSQTGGDVTIGKHGPTCPGSAVNQDVAVKADCLAIPGAVITPAIEKSFRVASLPAREA
jgi:hypothetical protein